MGNINSAVSEIISIANNNVYGYDQTNRNGPDFDCSSLIGTVLNNNGFNISKNSTTRNLYEQLISCGFEVVNDKNKKGDIYLTPGKHVIMCIDDNKIAHAKYNENKGIVGGVTGDQTGEEICIENFYIPDYGWAYHLRYKEEVKSIMCTGYANNFSENLAGEYTVTTDLYCRNEPNPNSSALCVIPKNTKVRNYGYYSTYNNVNWLLIKFTINNTTYTGFSSSLYLKK